MNSVMAELISIHPDNPQSRLLARVVEVLQQGGVIAYPTDSAYALGCRLNDKTALDRIRKLRGIDQRHYLTLVCRDLSEISRYAQLDNKAFRLLKANTPGAYTFLLPATRQIPRYFQRKSRPDIGLRIPDHHIVQELLCQYGEAIASASLILPEGGQVLHQPSDIFERLKYKVDMVVDGGYCGIESTTIVDLRNDPVQIIRHGKGDVNSIMG